jgi:hypothetical protein
MFKFVSKGDAHDNVSAVFFNGQKIYTMYVRANSDGSVEVQVEDGSGRLMKEWEDFLEESD